MKNFKYLFILFLGFVMIQANAIGAANSKQKAAPKDKYCKFSDVFKTKDEFKNKLNQIENDLNLLLIPGTLVFSNKIPIRFEKNQATLILNENCQLRRDQDGKDFCGAIQLSMNKKIVSAGYWAQHNGSPNSIILEFTNLDKATPYNELFVLDCNKENSPIEDFYEILKTLPGISIMTVCPEHRYRKVQDEEPGKGPSHHKGT